MIMHRIAGKLSLFFLLLFFLYCQDAMAAREKPLDLPVESQSVPMVYSGQETLHYALSWSGGIKIGDLYLTLSQATDPDEFLITARVTDYGLFKLFYPVDDTFTTLIGGRLKLPLRYAVQQKEGRGKEYHRVTIYDQKNFTARYRKNDNPEEHYQMGGPSYNEYSSFYITRVLALRSEIEEIVPTFVDKKRHMVAVKVFGLETRQTLFGRLDTIKVMPKMEFKGLYDKDGDTVFWLTDDACRIPVEIQSKILIGSLVAKLVEYSNPACPLQQLKPAEDIEDDEELF